MNTVSSLVLCWILICCVTLPIPVKCKSGMMGQYKNVPHKPIEDKHIAIWQNVTSPTTRLNETLSRKKTIMLRNNRLHIHYQINYAHGTMGYIKAFLVVTVYRWLIVISRYIISQGPWYLVQFLILTKAFLTIENIFIKRSDSYKNIRYIYIKLRIKIHLNASFIIHLVDRRSCCCGRS